MKYILLSFSFLICIVAEAQYLYKDLISAQQTSKNFSLLKQNKVRAVKVLSFESDNTPTPEFSIDQTVIGNYTQLKTKTQSGKNSSSVVTGFFDGRSRITRSSDTTGTNVSLSQYGYDSAGNIISITNTSFQIGSKERYIEKHLWAYDQANKPTSMTRIRPGGDTLFYSFKKDANGNIIEEEEYQKTKSLGKIYYYYNQQNQLTDVVRYNPKAKRLLPDYMFEYDKEGRLAQLITVDHGSGDYIRWRYYYDESGLKNRDEGFGKRSERLGRIEYRYTF